MEIEVDPAGSLRWDGQTCRCALGRAGVREDKQEGDGATPAGSFPLRGVLYRADRVAPPETALEAWPLAPDDGWCDDPDHADYNRPVQLPHPASAEALWREDGLYDVIVVLGHNDGPVTPGAGSAIFLHVAAPDYTPTEGCVAVALEDLLAMLRSADAETELVVSPR